MQWSVVHRILPRINVEILFSNPPEFPPPVSRKFHSEWTVRRTASERDDKSKSFVKTYIGSIFWIHLSSDYEWVRLFISSFARS
jgi:hypothetical protein